MARYVKIQAHNDAEAPMKPNYSNRKMFTLEQETALAAYIIDCSKRFYGLPLIECRKIAYELAVANILVVPDAWHDQKLAGFEWLRHFRKRHPILSLSNIFYSAKC